MSRRMHGFRLAAVGAVSSGVVLAAMTAPAAASDDVVLSVGHVDALEVTVDGDRLVMMVKDDTSPPPVFRDPADVTFQVLPGAAVSVPNDDRYSFLGEPGDTVWILPQTQDPNLLWPGWSTERIGSGVLQDNRITLTLESVTGPGQVTVFNIDAFGNPLIRWRAVDGTVDPASLNVPINTHAHGAWAFDTEGAYTLTFRADATLANGTSVTTGSVAYEWIVGDLPGQDTTLTINGMAGSYGPGDTVTLTAVQNPDTGEDRYRWYSRCSGAGDFDVISGATGGTYSFTADSELNGCAYLVRLFDQGDQLIAASDPVTLNVAGNGGADPDASQTIIAKIDEADGALVISVDPNDRTVMMSVAELNGAGDRLVSTGELRPVTVTDTRQGAPGWNASGQVGDFSGGAGSFGGRYLGWSPTVLAQSDGQGVVAGDSVSSGFGSGNGLADSRTLGSAAAGKGLGTARLGADLRLELPTETPAGEYVATLTLTAI